MKTLITIILLSHIYACSSTIPLQSTGLVGTWSFEGPECRHSNTIQFQGNGRVFLRESFSGLWVIDNGAVLMLLQDTGPDADKIGVHKTTLSFDSLHKNNFQGTFLEVEQKVTGYRCKG